MTVGDLPAAVTICSGQGLYLCADDAGLILRNHYFGRARQVRIAWTEISGFADSTYTKEGQTSWMLVIVLHTGQQVRVLSSVLGSPGAVVSAIRAAAEPHGIRSDLAGVPMVEGRPDRRGVYEDPGRQPGVRYWDGSQWSPLLRPDVRKWAVGAVRKSAASWSHLPTADGHWTYAATRATRQTRWFAALTILSAALLTGGLVTLLWWDRHGRHAHISSLRPLGPGCRRCGSDVALVSEA